MWQFIARKLVRRLISSSTRLIFKALSAMPIRVVDEDSEEALNSKLNEVPKESDGGRKMTMWKYGYDIAIARGWKPGDGCGKNKQGINHSLSQRTAPVFRPHDEQPEESKASIVDENSQSTASAPIHQGQEAQTKPERS